MQQTGGIGIWPSTAILIVTADSSFSVGQGLGHLIEVPVCLGILVKLLAAPWHSFSFGYQTQGSRVHICCLWRQDHLSIQVQQFCKELGLWRQSLNFQLAHQVALWSVLPNLALEGNWQHQKILFFKQVQELFIWFWLVVKGFKRHSLLGTDYPLRLNP